MKPRHNNSSHTGKLGEEFAARFLERLGFEIIHRNWRCGREEIDLVAKHEGWLVFVEVKTRSNVAFGQPWESVDQRKQDAMIRAAESYLEATNTDADIRFDIVSVTLNASGIFEAELFSHVFML